MATKLDSKGYQNRAEKLEKLAKAIPAFSRFVNRAATKDRNRASESFAREIGILI